MRGRRVNWEAFLNIGLNLALIAIVFLLSWGLGHIPMYHQLLGIKSLTTMGYFGVGLLYSFSGLVIVVVLYCLIYGSFMLIGYLFPEKED